MNKGLSRRSFIKIGFAGISISSAGCLNGTNGYTGPPQGSIRIENEDSESHTVTVEIESSLKGIWTVPAGEKNVVERFIAEPGTYTATIAVDSNSEGSIDMTVTPENSPPGDVLNIDITSEDTIIGLTKASPE